MKRRPRRTLPILPSVFVPPPEIRVASGSVMQARWLDPEDSRAIRTVGGFRTFCPLRKCRANHGERSRYTAEHVMAADRLRLLADGAWIGFSGGRELVPVQAASFGPVTGPGVPAVRSARAWRDFNRAMGLFDQPRRELLARCVLMNWSVRHWLADLRERGLPARALTESQRLAACLDLLVEHFDSEIQADMARGVVV